MSKILVIAPHADDEILGCGGTIKKKIDEGIIVHVLVLTNAHVGMPEVFTEELIEKVRKEAIMAHQILGVQKTMFKDFPAPKLDQFPIAVIANAISEIINTGQYDTVYIPHHGDIHIDHKVTFEAATVACRPLINSPVRNIFSYETLSETEWANPNSSDYFIPNYFEILPAEAFAAKCDALTIFKSQLKEFPCSRSLETVEALAKYRGATISYPKAEAFRIIRMVN